MSNSFDANKDPSLPGGRGEPIMATHGARAEYIRIARALLGVTPAQLASQIGAAPPARVAEIARPTQTLDRLSGALQAVISWYHTSLGSTPEAGEADAIDGLALDTLVHKYLELRSNWENREAANIATRMTRQARSPVDEPSAPIAPSEPTFTTAHRTALLVDDASDVVVTVGAFLESFGFQVLRANTGDHALEILATGAAVDLLVTDHAMPGMTGRDLAVQACQQRSALRALIITGYPDADDLAMLPERVLLLAKPFRRIELREKINALFGVGKVAELQKVDNAALRGL